MKKQIALLLSMLFFSANVFGAYAPLPSGAVMAFARPTCPPGWLPTDGTAVSRTTYKQLFTVMSGMFGVGDGTTTFTLPDFRGRFLRSAPGATSNDPDSASRTGVTASTWTTGGGATTNGTSTVTMTSTAGVQVGQTISGTNIPASSYVISVIGPTSVQIGDANGSAVAATGTSSGLTLTLAKSSSGRFVGSYQTNAYTAHNHRIYGEGGGGGPITNCNNGGTQGIMCDSGNNALNYFNRVQGGGGTQFIENSGGSTETRPDNLYVLYCVKI